MDSAVAYEAIDVGSNPSRSAVERLDCLSFYMYTNSTSLSVVQVNKFQRSKWRWTQDFQS